MLTFRKAGIMNGELVEHPYQALMAEAKREREIVDSPEAKRLQDAIFKAVDAYSTFLERNVLTWESGPDDPDWSRLKARALVVTVDYGLMNGIQIDLKDGALDRVYGNGVNPDPPELGPPDIPLRKRRTDE
jgi:hypothetical protein